ncbi:MAG: uL15 family ribosomal protein, partial [Oscillospiraceae bacterium]|nr:uL15 family ribosomal protein [Oscillospiraceae bacterium]
NSINVERLAGFEVGAVVDIALLLEKGIISKALDGIVIMGRGEIANAITVKANRFTASAKAKIEAAGGTCLANNE